MNIIFFNSPIGTNKIRFTISDKKLDFLIKEGVIPKESATLIKKYSDNLSDMDRAFLAHIDKVVFDDYKKPTKVMFDMDLVKMFFLELYRTARMEKLTELDGLQLRALTKGMTDVVTEIEKDKIALRDMPKTIMSKIADLDCFYKVNKVLPQELMIDYNEKYGYRLK